MINAATGSERTLPTFGDLYYKRDDGFFKKLWVITKVAASAFLAISSFYFNPHIFIPMFFVGLTCGELLERPFEAMSNLFKISYIASTIIIGLGVVLGLPTSAFWVCGFVALWCGKCLNLIERVANPRTPQEAAADTNAVNALAGVAGAAAMGAAL